MKLSSKILIILYLYAITFFGYSASEKVTVEVENESTENDTFVPTKEWQIIKEGQSIPAGLHIRLNLETGVREAKILDEKENENQNENENKNTQLNVVPDNIQSSSEGEGGTETLMTKTLKDAIKKANESPEQIEWISQEEEQRIKKTYKDYKQLKKDYDEMKSNFKTDMEIITELLDEFNHTKDDDSTSNIINLLNDLNYLVHQIDNALWFIDSGGLNSLILPMVVNQTYLPYRIASLRLLGALTQNNPKAQIKVYENNFGSYISNILLQSSDTDELSTAVYAFGSILRKFPIAQKEILSQSGTKALISVLQKNIDLKVKAKVLTLISDLIIDKENVLQINDSDITDLEKLNQYAEVNLLQWLIENQYCSTVIEFITESYLDIIRKPDIADDLIESMNTTNSSCQKLWSENYNFMKILKSIEVNFLNSGNEYQVEIGEKIQSLILSIGDKYEMNRKKDEL